MMKKMIRKLAALALALVLVLGCAAASAVTVDVSLKVDSENAKTALGSLGMPEEQQAGLDAVAKLLSALGVKVTALTDGAEIALSLDGKEAVKAGFASAESGAAVVETTPPSAPRCKLCGAELEKTGMPDPDYWWCQGCKDFFAREKVVA